MKHRLFTLASALSALLCGLVLIDWCTHHWRSNQLVYCHRSIKGGTIQTFSIAVTGSDGVLAFQVGTIGSPASRPFQLESGFRMRPKQITLVLHRHWLARRGFDLWHQQRPPNILLTWSDITAVVIPSWFAAGVLAILPVIWVRRWRRQRAALPGFPVEVRETPESRGTQ